MAKRIKILVLAVLFLSTILLAGCETTKGVAIGVGATAVGVGKDLTLTGNAVKRADDWFRKNLW